MSDWTVVESSEYHVKLWNEREAIQVEARWDGCIHVRRFLNGSLPTDPVEDWDSDYIHICEPVETLRLLTESLRVANAEFAKHDQLEPFNP